MHARLGEIKIVVITQGLSYQSSVEVKNIRIHDQLTSVVKCNIKVNRIRI